MRILNTVFSSLFLLLLVACAGFQTAGEVQPGRYALRRGEPQVALIHFQRAAEMDPNYFTNFTLLKQGVWTYVGRAYYDAGNLPEARKALERADSLYNDDYMADLYLGLALAREGDRERGRKEIEEGLVGLANWLEWVDAYHLDGKYWDPARLIRSRIQQDLALLSGKEFNWSQMIAEGESVGNQMEDEIEKSTRRWQRDQRNSDGKSDERR
jgi:tetratricopeptide (TPR) repeat protein